jgi:hypothetical protein
MLSGSDPWLEAQDLACRMQRVQQQYVAAALADGHRAGSSIDDGSGCSQMGAGAFGLHGSTAAGTSAGTMPLRCCGPTAPVPPLYTAACGYPGCTNLSGPSEVTLVTNRGGVVCGGCGVVRYCCRKCAASSWPAHRKECKRLKMGSGRSPG